MQPDTHSTQDLRERGVRVTPQRALIWRVLVESGSHFTAEEVYERAGRDLPGLELSTVYRALEALENVGLVAGSRLPEGPRVFEAHPDDHSHLVCEECGGISHPDSGTERELLETLGRGSGGFEVRGLHVVARGRCAECVAAGSEYE